VGFVDAGQVSTDPSSKYFDYSEVEEISCPGNIHEFTCITRNSTTQYVNLTWNSESNSTSADYVKTYLHSRTNSLEWDDDSGNYNHKDKVILSSMLVYNENRVYTSLHRVNVTGVDGIADNGSASALVVTCLNNRNNSESAMKENSKTLVFEGN